MRTPATPPRHRAHVVVAAALVVIGLGAGAAWASGAGPWSEPAAAPIAAHSLVARQPAVTASAVPGVRGGAVVRTTSRPLVRLDVAAGGRTGTPTPTGPAPVTTTTTTSHPAHAGPGWGGVPAPANFDHQPTVSHVVSMRPVVAAVEAAPQQSIDGFGASGGWWPTSLAAFPASARAHLGQLLFGPSGLELSQYRYNIGGGGIGVTDRYKAPPTFLRPDGSYSWGADPKGLTFLQMAASYHVPQLIGFVNSAPPQYTSDAKSCGGTLNPSSINAYAGYLAQVVEHLYTADGIRLSYVSPMNEPDTSQPSCRQEGMAVPVAERAALVKVVAAAMSSTSAHPGVIGDESSLVRQVLAENPDWVASAGSALAVDAHHTYDYPGPAELSRLSSTVGVPHWASEICCFNGASFGWGFDPTMTSALWLANTIIGDLGTAHDSAFDWWVAASPNSGCDPSTSPGCDSQPQTTGRNDGLVYFDRNWRTDHDYSLYLTKRYWAMAAFSRYVRPGAVVHEVSGLPSYVRALAFSGPNGWTIVAVDSSSTNRVRTSFSVPAAVDGHKARAYVTSETSDLRATPASGGSGQVSVTVQPRSITTVVVPN